MPLTFGVNPHVFYSKSYEILRNKSQESQNDPPNQNGKKKNNKKNKSFKSQSDLIEIDSKMIDNDHDLQMIAFNQVLAQSLKLPVRFDNRAALKKINNELAKMKQNQTGKLASAEIIKSINVLQSEMKTLSTHLDHQQSEMNKYSLFQSKLNSFTNKSLMSEDTYAETLKKYSASGQLSPDGMTNSNDSYLSLFNNDEHLVLNGTREVQNLKDTLEHVECDNACLTHAQFGAYSIIRKLSNELKLIGKLESKLSNIEDDSRMAKYVNLIMETSQKALSCLKYPLVGTTLDMETLAQMIEAQLPFKMMIGNQKQPFWNASKWFLNPSVVLLEMLKLTLRLVDNPQNAITQSFLLSVKRIYNNSHVELQNTINWPEEMKAQVLAFETLFGEFNLILQQMRKSKTEFDVTVLDLLLLEIYRLYDVKKFHKLPSKVTNSLDSLTNSIVSQFWEAIRDHFGQMEIEMQKKQNADTNYFVVYLKSQNLMNRYSSQKMNINNSVQMNIEPISWAKLNVELPRIESPNLPNEPSNDELIKQIQELQAELNRSQMAIDQLTNMLSPK